MQKGELLTPAEASDLVGQMRDNLVRLYGEKFRQEFQAAVVLPLYKLITDEATKAPMIDKFSPDVSMRIKQEIGAMDAKMREIMGDNEALAA
jgi:hypothetical protein